MNASRRYRCDLHIHSCLSACADLLMTPGNIIKEATRLGLDCIAITDHNTGGNVQVAMELAKESGLVVIPAMEVETREEVHLLCLFPYLENLIEWDEIVAKNLPQRGNDEKLIGYQLRTDLNDQYIAKDERLLATATWLSLSETVATVSELGGTIIPSHVDRPVNSIVGQLGFIPPDSLIDTIEISKNTKPEVFFNKFPDLKSYEFITGSDSHYLFEVGKCGQKERGFPVGQSLQWVLAEFAKKDAHNDRDV